ncbi:MAG: hypothetical protein ACFNVT_01935 [Corynebacterium matruchotii]|uniref:hypothetical protein n=1 Tax=Corynebacterium matruchotii TaxID=43768 RepID=UPI0036065F40
MAFLTVALVVGYVISERQQYRMLHPTYPEQYSAGPATNQLVGAAIENYESVIDAESQNLDCTLQHCGTSSKSIPGVPADRALFTEAERFLLGWWPGAKSASTIRIYSVAQRPDKTVEAIVDVTITKCAYPETKNPYMIVTDPHRMILTPSTLNQHEYVVVEDAILDRHEAQEYPESFQPLYVGKGKETRC